LPKFGEWDVNDPSSAEGFTVIFNKARNEKKGGGKSDSPGKDEPGYNKNGEVLEKPAVSRSISSSSSSSSFNHIMDVLYCFLHDLQKKWFCCIRAE